MKAVILDRDGVINKNAQDNGYVCKWSDFIFIRNSLQAIRILFQNGWTIFIATNQAGIGKGLLSEQQLQTIHNRMQYTIEENGGKIQNIYYCPHAPETGCQCRKPKPGMLTKVKNEYNIDMSKTYFIGDSFKDIQAARSAKAIPILVLTGHGFDTFNQYINTETKIDTCKPEKIFTNLYTATRWITK